MSITSYSQAPWSCFIARRADGKRLAMTMALSRTLAVRHGWQHSEKNNSIPLYHLFIPSKIPVVSLLLSFTSNFVSVDFVSYFI